MPLKDGGHFLELFDVRPLAKNTRQALSAPIHLVFVLLILLLAIGGWLARRHTSMVYRLQDEVSRTHALLAGLNGLLATSVDAETGVRGFVATGQERFLEPYREAAASISSQVMETRLLAASTHVRPSELDRFQARLSASLEHLGELLVLARHDREAAVESLHSVERRRIVDELRSEVERIASEQMDNLRSRQSLARRNYLLSEAFGWAVTVVGILLIIVLYNLIQRFGSLRARTTLAIGDARERLEVALDCIADAVLIADFDGRLVYCNDSCRSTFQFTDTDIGRTLRDLLVTASGEPSDLSEGLFRQALAATGTHCTKVSSELRLADGRHALIDGSAARIKGTGDQARGVVLVLRDVTERREQERALDRSHERFRALVLATSQIVWTTTPDGQVSEDSPSWRAYTGQTYEQWCGLGWLDAIHPDDREATLESWRRAVSERQPLAVEYRLRRADGSYCWNLVRAVPVRDDDGTVREWVGMNHDIEELKQAEATRREANQRKDEFIALLAHELRNPLAPLRNGLELIKAVDGAPHRTAIEMMDRQVDYLVRLIDDLLNISRIRLGRLELRRSQVDLRDVLSEAVEVVRTSVDAKSQDLSVSLSDAPLWVDGDPVRLLQVFSNLLHNSVKYSGRGESIWVTAEREGPRVVVSVRDTGRGIEPELLPRIWDLFLQGADAAEGSEGGLGIGLTLVKRLVEMHAGSVEVESPGTGLGSEFTVTLPGLNVKPQQDAPPPAPPTSASRRLRILVIDDNEDSAESTAMLLRIGGHDVRTASTGREGLAACEPFAPELILCDIRMPDLSGYEVARRIRSGSGPLPLLVAMTGFGTQSDRAASQDAGFDRHCVKPLSLNDLAAILGEAADRPPEA